MGIHIKGTFRVQSIYQGDKASYLTLKDKGTSEIVKVGIENPMPKAVVDDGLIVLDGPLAARIFQNNVSLTYTGSVVAGSDK